MAKALMIIGTTSDAGKSLICAALCRHFSRLGYNTVPFKTLNVSLNAYSTADGGEIGISQAFQAWAAGKEPTVCMNPILVKPHGGGTCQYVVEGRPFEARGDSDMVRALLWERVNACYHALAKDADIVICEGSGSPAEVNLRDHDIANMHTAHLANAPTILVGDIDAGGVFAGIYGTYELLRDEDKRLLSGYIINRFRGDASILRSGTDLISSLTGMPCLGVVPYVPLVFPAEDSLSVARGKCTTAPRDDIRSSWLDNLGSFLSILSEHVSLDRIESIVRSGVNEL